MPAFVTSVRVSEQRLSLVAVTSTWAVYSRASPSLSRIFACTVRVPVADVEHVAVLLGPKLPYPLPQSNAYANPALVSAVDGSLAPVSDSVNEKPANTDDGALSAADGATFTTLTVADDTADSPPPSVACTLTVRDVGPSSATAENVAFCPAVSNVPLSSRSHA